MNGARLYLPNFVLSSSYLWALSIRPLKTTKTGKILNWNIVSQSNSIFYFGQTQLVLLLHYKVKDKSEMKVWSTNLY